MANGSGYSAGNLEFTVKQVSTEALTSLDNLIAKLKTTSSLLGSISSIPKKLGSTTGRSGRASSYEREHKVVENNRLKSLTTVKKTGKELSKITKVYNAQNEVIKKTITNVDKLGNKTTQIYKQNQEEEKKLRNNKLPNSFSVASLFNKVYFLRNYTKQMFASMRKVLGYAIEYTETLNLWQVAMRNNREEADEFVKTMNKAYGISTQTLMNYQAIFRNMLSSLGGVSEGTSYALSEYLTQMAVDYASLYNTSIDRAMTTFQSVLSGQVRPIRSIAGYDITETTIFQLYQQLGGTKTMRQLTQTEKRLLRIYAVFQQMESSGAIGDLNRTLGNTANQMRIMSEASKELQTWFGLIVEDIFKPALPIINAFLITLTNITKAIAKMRGVELFEGGAVESVQEINEALDETTGKLLSFDRFEALKSSEDSGSNLLGIDENLLNGLSRYKSLLSEVTGQAQELAEKWTSWFVDVDTGELTTQAQILLNLLNGIAGIVLALISFNLIKKIGNLSLSLLGLKDTNIVSWLQNIQLQGKLATTTTQKMSVGFDYLKVAIVSAILSFTLFDSIIGALDGTARKVVSIISIVIGALGTVLGLILAIKGGLKGGLLGATIAGLGVGALIAGIKGISTSNSKLQVRKSGGMVEDGVFTMNKGEIIGNFDDGTTVVANNQQIIAGIQQGVFTAVSSAMRQSGGAGIGDVILDGRKVGYTTAKYSHQENVRSGYIRATR